MTKGVDLAKGLMVMFKKKTKEAEKKQSRVSMQMLIRISKLLLKFLPVWSFAILFIMILQGLLPVLNVYLIGRFTGILVENSFVLTDEAVKYAILVAVSFCFDALCSECNHLIRVQSSYKMEYKLRKMAIQQVEKIDIRYKEQREYQTIVSRANQAINPMEMFNFLDMFSTVVSAIISMFGVTILLIYVNVIIPIFILTWLFVGAAVMRRSAMKMNQIYESTNEEERKTAMISSWFISENFNAEMRIYRTFGWFMKLWSDMFRRLNQKRNKGFTRIELVQGLLNTLILIMPVFAVMIYILMGKSTGADLAEDVIDIFNSCNVMTLSIMMLTSVISMFVERLLNFENFFRLFDIKEKEARTEGEACKEAKIVLEKATFSYDESDPLKVAVNGVDLQLESGKVYAIVGENGSGKSTLAKLLLQLYHPQKGSVKAYDDSGNEMTLRATTVVQDFARYDLSLKANILLGDYKNEKDEDAYKEALEDSSCKNLAAKIGEETILGTRFGNVNLSGGEWQRLAVARGFFRKNCPLVLFDEPDASLDAIAESNIIKNMASRYKESICVFITHRLASVKYADKIFVMKDGRLIEQGSHSELMIKNGLYKEMFAAQVGWYQ